MKKLMMSFGYAFKGLHYAASTQLNFRIHLTAVLIGCILGYYLHVSTNEWLWLILCFALVLTLELINTALEILTDMVSPDYNEQAGHVKDVSAAAVTVTAAFALITAAIIFLPKLILLIK